MANTDGLGMESSGTAGMGRAHTSVGVQPSHGPDETVPGSHTQRWLGGWSMSANRNRMRWVGAAGKDAHSRTAGVGGPSRSVVLVMNGAHEANVQHGKVGRCHTHTSRRPSLSRPTAYIVLDGRL